MILCYNRVYLNANTPQVFLAPRRVLTSVRMITMAPLSIPRTSGIYKITCTANGKIYIGSSNNLRSRWANHRAALRNNRHENSYLQATWDKYGEQNFIFDIIEIVMPWALLDREQHWINKLNACDRSIGFNLALYSTSPMKGRKASIETRNKMSIAHKGKKHTPEAVEKVAAANRGQKRSPQTCANISAALKGRELSPEAYAKSAASRTGLKRSLEANIKTGISNSKDYIITTPNGDEFEITNLSRFCKENRLSDLPNVVCGKRKHCKGWKARLVT